MKTQKIQNFTSDKKVKVLTPKKQVNINGGLIVGTLMVIFEDNDNRDEDSNAH